MNLFINFILQYVLKRYLKIYEINLFNKKLKFIKTNIFVKLNIENKGIINS